MVMRIALLLTLSWVMGLTGELFRVADQGFSGRDLILLVGGLFLIAKATHEIHTKLEGPDEHPQAEQRIHASMASVIAQIMAFDLVFSIDSVITAIGMARAIWVMVDRDRDRGRDDAGLREPGRRLRRAPPLDQDARALVPDADRRDARGRGHGPAHQPRLRLLRDGLLALRRAAEPALAGAREGGGA